MRSLIISTDYGIIRIECTPEMEEKLKAGEENSDITNETLMALIPPDWDFRAVGYWVWLDEIQTFKPTFEK